MSINMKKVTGFLLLVLFFAAATVSYSVEAYAQNSTIPDGYNMVAESDICQLYLYEPTMSIIVKDKATGALMLSTLTEEDDDGKNNSTWTAYMQSGIVLTAIKGTTDTYQVDLVKSANTIEYTYKADGFSAKIYFKEYRFGLTVDVALDGEDLVAEVLDQSVIEEGDGMYIGTVSLFPFMGYTYLDSQDGYMLIPDGNGALIYLNDKNARFTTGFSQMIYGADAGFSESSTDTLLWGYYKTVRDAKKVIAPVFGMIHSDDNLGYLAIVEKGDKRASIEAHPNGVMVDYNRCFVKFLLRRIYVQPLNNSNSGTMTSVEADRTHSDLKIRYRMLSGESADYSGMAVAYRNYLLDSGQISKKDTSYNTRVDFLGTDREEFLVFTKAVTMTTTDQIKDIYSYFKASGINSLLTVYKGWQSGGIYNIPITQYKADSSIGGTSDLTKLIKEAAEDNYNIYLYNDALLANPATGNTTFNTAKKINKRRLQINMWGQVYDYFNYLLPSKSASTLEQFANSYTKKGVSNLALTGITDHIYSYSQSSSFYSRFDCAQSYDNTFSQLAQKTNLIAESPFAYLWDDTEAFLDMPIVSSSYMYVDEEVPFLSMVLKGLIPMYSEYVNFEANKNEFKLQMIEAGVYPSFYLTYKDSSELIYTNSSHLYSTLYVTYQDTIVEYDAMFSQLANAVQDAFIIKHKRTGDVSAVTYDNGAVIYVNYSDSPVTVDGYTIEGMSYKIGDNK